MGYKRDVMQLPNLSIGPDFNGVKIALIDQVNINIGSQNSYPENPPKQSDDNYSPTSQQDSWDGMNEHQIVVDVARAPLNIMFPSIMIPALGSAFYLSAEAGAPLQSAPLIAAGALTLATTVAFLPTTAVVWAALDGNSIALSPAGRISAAEVLGQPVRRALTVGTIAAIAAWGLGNAAHNDHFSVQNLFNRVSYALMDHTALASTACDASKSWTPVLKKC